MVVAATMVFAGLYHTCAVYYGNVKCWGGNDNGQLGYNHTMRIVSPTHRGFLPVGGEVITLFGAYLHTCAVLSGGNLKCWGYNAYGQLGYSHSNDVYSPANVDFVPVGGAVTAVVTGQFHTCALLSTGTVKCWGGNSYGQLGYNHTNTLFSPAVAGYVSVGGDVAALAAGELHTCALLTNGSVKCWGSNSFGQLGYNHTDTVLAPAAVHVLPFEDTVIAISAGMMHTCALLVSGNVKCWGDSSCGQLGFNNTAKVLSPGNMGVVPVGGNATAIAAGACFTCALLTSGTMKCWGDNGEGQLGYGNTVTVLSPANTGALPIVSISAISTGHSHTCAVRSSGGIVCWGWNAYGQLGNNDTRDVRLPSGDVLLLPAEPSPSASPSMSATTTVTSSASPSQSASSSAPPMPPPVFTVAAGSVHTCATFFGNLKCWGANSQGQLGYNRTDSMLGPLDLGVVPVGANVTATCGGSSHTCALLSSGDMKCWGQNTDGELGYNHTRDVHSLPDLEVVPIGAAVRAIAAGQSHTCALVSNSVKCWGQNGQGQLGYNDTYNVLSPAAVGYVPVGGEVVAVTAGRFHTCAVLANGKAKCWGWNFYGQLGYNHTTDVLSPDAVGYIPIGGNVEAITAGHTHTCALLFPGDVKCWGQSAAGQLGYGNKDSVLSPESVGLLPIGGQVTAIAAGAYYSCALLKNTSMKCWGSNYYGQLGYTNYIDVLSPSDVGVLPISGVVAVSTGGAHTCVVHSKGSINCWGWNANGQLGYNDTGDVLSPASAGDVPLLPPVPSPSSTPYATASASITARPTRAVSVTDEPPALTVTAAYSHTCASFNGSLKCWGGNFYGQLGYNHTKAIVSPRYAGTVPVGENVTSTAAGERHTCALLTSGSVKCWGSNSYGQLGYNHTNNILSPADIGFVPVGGNVSALTSGRFHVCALLTSGGMKCWGQNTHGQLGYNNSNIMMLSPAEVGYVPVGGNVMAITAGQFHTCALLFTGNIKCWGRNLYGELGYNHTTNVLSPANVGFIPISNVTAIAGGEMHTCAATVSGDMKCWGGNTVGELGYNNTQNVWSPANAGFIPVGGNVSAIAARGYFTCVLLVSGKMKCWGYNGLGQLGYGHTSDILSPENVDFVPISDVSAINAGHRHICAVRSGGGIVCWGWNAQGQLGDNSTYNVFSPALADDVPLLSSELSPSSTPSATAAPSATAMASPTVSVPVAPCPALAVTAAYRQTCAIINGSIKCWGNNDYSQLGYNHTQLALSPADADYVPVGGLVISIASGFSHTCAQFSGGDLKCWGSNSFGQLGYNHRSDLHAVVDLPVVPVGGTTIAITAGKYHTCALLSTGGMKCWGHNGYGQLGYNNTNDVLSPANVWYVLVGGQVASITAGDFHTCALLSSGDVKCWGRNLWGELGYNNTAGVISPADVGFLPIGSRVRSISAGAVHTCAATLGGAMKCWGSNALGNLGYNNTFSVLSPGNVGFIPVGGNVIAIAAGTDMTCALLASAQLKCWGDNSDGQLGYGHRTNIFSPENVGLVPIDDVLTVSVGSRHTCVLLTSARVFCWGSNVYGQLGYNDTNGLLSHALYAVSLTRPELSPCTSATPSPNDSNGVPAAISTASIPSFTVTVAYSHTCATINGSVKCWGDNSAGQLGYNHTNSIMSPTNVGYVPVGGTVVKIAAYMHTCALLADGSMKCWGSNSFGQLGYNHTRQVYSPADVNIVPVGGNVTAISTGDAHTCALLSSGDVKCWGYNYYGQLGYNHVNDVLSPSNVGYVPIGGKVKAIAAARDFTCSLLFDGTMKCWGANGYGQLGYNHTNNVLSPSAAAFVPVGGNVTGIAVGSYHTCALLASGDVKCWGRNLAGQLGYGNTDAVLSPESVGSVLIDGNVSIIHAGGESTCASFVSGRLKCWGNNGQGQLGYGNYYSVLLPSTVGFVPVPDFASISMGDSHMCALRPSGGIVCWGWNYHGQLGYNHTNGVLSPTAVGDVALFPLPPSPSATLTASASVSRSITGIQTSTASPSPTPSTSARASSASTSQTPTSVRTPSATQAASTSPSRSSSPSAIVPTPSSTSSLSVAPTLSESMRLARAPMLELQAFRANAYAGDAAILKWMDGGDIPSQLLLTAMWRRSYNANETVDDDTKVILSDALPATVFLVRASVDIQDYIGISCALQPNLREFTNKTYLRVHTSPTSLYSLAPSREVTEHFHVFYLTGERSLLGLGGSFEHQSGTFQCSPVFPPSLYVHYYPTAAARISLVPGLWAIPRGAMVTSSHITRSVGIRPPSCFDLSRNDSTGMDESLWRRCTSSQLDDYVQNIHAEPVQPSWLPSTLDLNAASNITFIFQLTDIPGGLTRNISIGIGNASCNILDRLLVSDVIFIRCESPNFETGCVRLNGRAECAPQRLSVQVGDRTDIANLKVSLSDAGDTASSGAFFPTLLRCDPFCDLLGTPTYIRTVLRDISGPAKVDGAVVYEAPIAYDNTIIPSAVLISGPRLQKRPPVTYMDVCLGFTDPLSGACTNTSMMEQTNCAFGGGSDCRPCPRGAVCPGGYRAMPMAGFWAASVSAGSIVQCAPPAERCLGWDQTANLAVCAEGYDTRSPGCGWCAEGYFKGRGSGKCPRCPSADDPSAIIIPILLLVAVVMGIVSTFMVVVWTVSKLFGGSMRGGVRRVVEFASAVFQSIQLVSTVTSAAGNALPALMRPVVDVLNALQIQGLLVDEACMQHQDPYTRVYVLSGFALLVAIALLSHTLLAPKSHNALQVAGAKVLALFFACYGLVAQTVMSAYQCAPSTMPLRSALPTLLRESDAGQSVLASVGIEASPHMLATCDANEFMDGCAAFTSVLSGDVELTVTRAYGRTDLCGGTVHALAVELATIAFVLALLAIPIVLFYKWCKLSNVLPSSQISHDGLKPTSYRAKHNSVLHRQSVNKVSGLQASPTATQQAESAGNAFDIFLNNQRYVKAKAYWWQLDCLLLLVVSVLVHAIGKPSTLLGIWLQAAGICGACMAATAGKIVTKPYKAENFHLFITAAGIQVYSVLVQLLMAIAYSAELSDAGANVRTALTLVSLICVAAAALLLLTVAITFLYSLVGGAIMEQRDTRLREEARKQKSSEMTSNPLLAYKQQALPSKRMLAESDIEGGIDKPTHIGAGVQRVNMRAEQVEGKRETRNSVSHNLTPVQLRRPNRSIGRISNREAQSVSFVPKPVEE